MKYLTHDYNDLEEFKTFYEVTCSVCTQKWVVMKSVIRDVSNLESLISKHSKLVSHQGTDLSGRTTCDDHQVWKKKLLNKDGELQF